MNTTRVVIAGAGSLGSQFAHHIAAPGIEVVVIDDDKVEANNVYVSVFSQKHLQQSKADVVAEIVNDRGGHGIPVHTTLEHADQIKALNPDIVVDCFDNLAARKITTNLGVPTLHVGVGLEGNGILFWDDDYVVPPGDHKRGDNPLCTNTLGAPLLRRTALRASEIFAHWYHTDEQISDIVSVDGKM